MGLEFNKTAALHREQNNHTWYPRRPCAHGHTSRICEDLAIALPCESEELSSHFLTALPAHIRGYISSKPDCPRPLMIRALPPAALLFSVHSFPKRPDIQFQRAVPDIRPAFSSFNNVINHPRLAFQALPHPDWFPRLINVSRLPSSAKSNYASKSVGPCYFPPRLFSP